MKRSALAAVVAAGSGLIWSLTRRRSGSKQQRAEGKSSPPENADEMLRYTILFILPVWTGAGVADYLWHRRTKIETTSGVEESFMHLLMMAEMAPALLAGLFLEVNATALAVMIGSFAAHQATAVWDVGFTSTRRMIPTGEQHTHSFLEMAPFCMATFAICTHWDEFMKLLGRGPERPKFEIKFRRPRSPWRTAGIAGVHGLAAVLPHVEELWRCWQAERSGKTGRDTPECVRDLYSEEHAPALLQ